VVGEFLPNRSLDRGNTQISHQVKTLAWRQPSSVLTVLNSLSSPISFTSKSASLLLSGPSLLSTNPTVAVRHPSYSRALVQASPYVLVVSLWPKAATATSPSFSLLAIHLKKTQVRTQTFLDEKMNTKLKRKNKSQPRQLLGDKAYES